MQVQTRPQRSARPDTKPAPRRPRVIRVPSSCDPDSRMLCCGQPATQKQITYEVTVNQERFRVEQVWASVCDGCHQAYFAPEVGAAIADAIFARQYPREAQIARLTSE